MDVNQLPEKFQIGLWVFGLSDAAYAEYGRTLAAVVFTAGDQNVRRGDAKAIAERLKKYLSQKDAAPKSIKNSEDFVRLCYLLQIDSREYDELATLAARPFFDLLDADKQAKALRKAKASGQQDWISSVLGGDLQIPPALGAPAARAPSPAESPNGGTLHVMRTNLHDYRDRTLIKAIGANEIDQKFMYLDPQAVDHWRTLTHDTNRYPTFKYCSEALGTLLSTSDCWKTLLARGSIGRVVVLGAGASEKDIAILDSFSAARAYQNRPERLRYVIVDSSPYMLGEAAATIGGVSGGFRDIARIESAWADFMHLDRLKEEFGQKQIAAPEGTKSAYFCLGGTISNINEEAFFTSVNAVAQSGDLLVIGVEFFDLDSVSDYRAVLETKYDHAHAKQLVMPVARYIAEKQGKTHVSEKDIDVRIEGPKKLRRLQNVVSAKFSIKLPEQYTLVVANRYVEQEFVGLAKSHDFERAETHASRQYDRYKILVLVKT